MENYTLAQIKSHPLFPFSDFESNPLSFSLLRLYWYQLFFELIGESENNWVCVREAEMDGNPIFDAESLVLGRAIRIIHKVNVDNKPIYPLLMGEGAYYQLQAWLNNTPTFDNKISLNELVLYADLSSEAEKEASNLIKLHCVELANKEIVEKAIVEYEKRVKMPE